jgi:uncharacterized protein
MNEPDQILNDKLKLLESWFSCRKGSIVAFSGGIDSTLVLFLARRFQGRQNVMGVISNSESLKNKDFNLAQTFCKEFDIPIRIIKTDELSDVRYSQNPVNRCFFCKDHLFQDLQKMLPDYPGHVILSGTNYDDLGDYRPGLDAAHKNGIESPLVDCKISKEEVRAIARHFNLPNWNKPASPCLSSRIPYNQVVTAEKLRQIEAAENILNSYGFEDVRVRHYNTYAKVEVLQADLEKLAFLKGEIIREIMAIGFERVEIDPEGLVSGKMNRVLKPEESKK